MTTLYYEDQQGQVSTALRLDIIDTVRDRNEELITDLPLESGRNVNDNAVSEPRTMALTATVSLWGEGEGRESRPKEVWELLKKLMTDNTFLTLVDEIDVTQQLIIQDLERVQNYSTGRTLQVRMTLKQINFVDVSFSAINGEMVGGVLGVVDEFTVEDLSESPAANKTSVEDQGFLPGTDVKNPFTTPFEVPEVTPVGSGF